MPLFNHFPVTIDCQGEKTNPTTSDVMADSGALSAGIYEALVLVSASATAKFQVERRNAANGASVGDVQIFYCGANTSVGFPFRFEIEKDERIRVMMNANLTGTATANVSVQRIG